MKGPVKDRREAVATAAGLLLIVAVLASSMLTLGFIAILVIIILIQSLAGPFL
jgi:hypothetical protein